MSAPSLPDALAFLAESPGKTKLLAGGTDLMVQWEAGVLERPNRILDISGIEDLGKCQEEGESLRLGAGMTHWQIRHSSLVQKYLPALAQAAATVGGCQIQQMGTLGGNVANASPAADLVPPLLIADADVEIQSKKETRRISLCEFYKGYRDIDLQADEMITGFVCQKKLPDEFEQFIKLGPRNAQAISKVMLAGRVLPDGELIGPCRCAMGSTGPTVMRLRTLEESLTGKRYTPDLLDQIHDWVEADICPMDDIRSTAQYRKWVAGNLVHKMLCSFARRSREQG